MPIPHRRALTARMLLLAAAAAAALIGAALMAIPSAGNDAAGCLTFARCLGF